MPVFFPELPARCTAVATVAFDAYYNGDRIICEISAEALNDHFGAVSFSSSDLVAAFERNRFLIETVARAVLPARAPAGRCLLVTADF
ncbi:DUF1488 family protein [Duganella sp. FT135W]|uniref:DUF1488 family protein n=1 Tax=Duganella flavida TaxID=2692175 RepID=A0A6L8K8Q4_9BURK|nr:DUF1488 domain-containing protein [Duganella flavida]MYM22204.1 DUF1488 family protein [Duganella flavida]